MTGIEAHWQEQQDEKMRYFARFADLVDNDSDRWIARGLGVTLGPRAVEHSKNVPQDEEDGA